MTDFVHLHVHSDYSLCDAAVSVMNLADKAEKLGMTHIALTDHGNMYGIMEFIAACEETVNENRQREKRKKPIKPIIGCEVYIMPGSRLDKNSDEGDNKCYHLILLASNRKGYFNLVKLCSSAFSEGNYPRINDELLCEYHKGLIALSACVNGEIPMLIQKGKNSEAEKRACYYRDLFGSDEKGNPNFYLEIQDQGIPAEMLNGSLSQKEINKTIIDIARHNGIPIVATNDIHYLNQEDYTAHDILLCIGAGCSRTDENRKKYYGDQFYFKNGDEMASLFSEYPEAVANTVRIAERCTADIPKIGIVELLKNLPDCQIPKSYDNADAYLNYLIKEGLAKRYSKEKQIGGKPWENIQKRAENELNIIIKKGVTSLFLIIEDIIKWAREHEIPVGQGRGSCVCSIVAYALQITDIDPIKYGLLFERFLNPEHIVVPDFDVDFANEGREEVIRYITEKYGKERVGHIITFGVFGTKTAIKDVARVLNISNHESDMITQLIPLDYKITLRKAIDEKPELRELEQDYQYTELFALAKKLEGLCRNYTNHASGIVIEKNDLSDYLPLYNDLRTGIITTQYSMNYMEICGLIKIDLLGLRILDDIKHSEMEIRKRGIEFANFSTNDVPLNDKATFNLFCEGDTSKVFQFENECMRNILQQLKPDCIELLIAIYALYRYGLMDYIPEFIERRHGRKSIEYPLPCLEDILKETYGIIVYQEQLMQIVQRIAGYTLAKADMFRRYLLKADRNKQNTDEEKKRFITGAMAQGFKEHDAENLFETLASIAGIVFSKSHAASYTVLAYRTAYLKANF